MNSIGNVIHRLSPSYPQIVNVCYHKDMNSRIYFDCLEGETSIEVKNYLKRIEEKDKHVIARNGDDLQLPGFGCDDMCLFVLKALADKWSFQDICDFLLN